MTEHVKATIDREIPPSVLRSEGDVLIAFGLAPPTFDYVGSIVTLMSTQLAGYYEPLDKTMYLAADLGEEEADATLSHELVHALQDQHYDLGRLLDYRPDDSDVQGAVHALAEGDATSAMLDALLEPQGAKAVDLSDDLVGVQVRAASTFSTSGLSIPDVLQRSLVAPYIDGIAFVHALRRRGGWAEVDRAWEHLPASTEQVLHPEKYTEREMPLVVEPPVGPDAALAKPVYTDVLGEESVRLILEEWVPRRTAIEAASGWGGDRGAVFRDGERVAVAWHLTDDDRASASRLAQALRRGVAAQRGNTAPGNVDCAERATLGPLFVAQQGRDVAIVAGPYARHGAAVVSAGSCSAAAAWAARILGKSQE
jgi:hypothetical protein